MALNTLLFLLPLTYSHQHHHNWHISRKADTGLTRCKAHEIFEQAMRNPIAKANYEKQEAFTQQFVKDHLSSKRFATEPRENHYIIPIVFNIIYNDRVDPRMNLEQQYIDAQIQVLNEDFTFTNPDIGNIPPYFVSRTTNFSITFELVNVVRRSTKKRSFNTDDSMKFASSGGIDATNPETTFNVWVCQLNGGILGYAQFPNIGANRLTDGAVVDWRTVGNTTINYDIYSVFNEGRTLTHEFGHLFNLRHIWGDANSCSASDFVADTPPQYSANTGCVYGSSDATLKYSCGSEPDNANNYMDYVYDACMNMFTEGQYLRGIALFEPGQFRYEMGQNALVNTGTGSPTPMTTSPTTGIPTRLTAMPTVYPVSSCLPIGASCVVNSDCCGNKCRGPSGNKSCK